MHLFWSNQLPIQPSLEHGSSTVQHQPISLTATKWLLCLLLAGGGAWIVFANPPITFEIPDDLKSVDPNSLVLAAFGASAFTGTRIAKT